MLGVRIPRSLLICILLGNEGHHHGKQVTLYLTGTTVPGGTAWKDATPYQSIAEALEGARIKASQNATTVEIQDEHGTPVLTWPEVQARLKGRPTKNR